MLLFFSFVLFVLFSLIVISINGTLYEQTLFSLFPNIAKKYRYIFIENSLLICNWTVLQPVTNDAAIIWCLTPLKEPWSCNGSLYPVTLPYLSWYLCVQFYDLMIPGSTCILLGKYILLINNQSYILVSKTGLLGIFNRIFIVCVSEDQNQNLPSNL